MLDYFTLLDIQWKPRIGDPSFMGWFTVGAYFAAALLCAWVAVWTQRKVSDPNRGRRVLMWCGVMFLMLMLGINKQLDLQSWFTAVGRAIAKEQGWYEGRREVQYWFTIIFSCGVLALLAGMAWLIRRSWRRDGMLLFGLFFITAFIILRAASFHHFETILKFRLAGARMNWILELAGIGIVSLAALRDKHRT